MAVIYLEHLNITPADDLTDIMRLHLDAAAPTLSVSGEIHTFGGGRQVAHLGPGVAESVPYTCEQVARADVEQLRAWVADATVLLFRDPRGGKTYGILFELPYVWTSPSEEIATVTLTVHAVTVDESA